jgi:cytidine deaminase
MGFQRFARPQRDGAGTDDRRAGLEYTGSMSYDDLIQSAARVLNPRRVDDRVFGDVAAALLTDRGHRYVGVCIDTACGTGFCAEHSAIAAMVTAGEYKIKRIVAVWRDEHGTLHVVPPCGRCREFIRQIDAENLATEVVLGPETVVHLRDLLPYHAWPAPPSPRA